MVNLEDVILNRSSINEIKIGELTIQAKDPKLIGRVFSYFAENAIKSNKKQEEYGLKLKSAEQKLKKEMKDAVFMLQGELYLKDGLYDKASERFFEAIRQNPENEFAHAKRALALAELFKEKYPKYRRYAKLKIKEKKCYNIGKKFKMYEMYNKKAEDYGKKAEDYEMLNGVDTYMPERIKYDVFHHLDSALSLNPHNRKIRRIRKKALSNNLNKKLEEIIGKLKKSEFSLY